MRVSPVVIAAFVLAATVTTGAAERSLKAGPLVSVVATADQKFDPAVVVMHVGRPQTLRLTSSGGMHGIASPELGIAPTTIAPDKPVALVVTPKKAGTYKLPCTLVCGPGHGDMLLTIEVKP